MVEYGQPGSRYRNVYLLEDNLRCDEVHGVILSYGRSDNKSCECVRGCRWVLPRDDNKSWLWRCGGHDELCHRSAGPALCGGNFRLPNRRHGRAIMNGRGVMTQTSARWLSTWTDGAAPNGTATNEAYAAYCVVSPGQGPGPGYSFTAP